ncbi:YdeI/OmpD-associated family protein [Paenibacillus sp. M1]|uniref:YdeI/OmpD-associated family protein n=1 Tax=Paenibacillus haidiansis TaxID=1574488 RepID=A0ABU7W094_9BACL
MNPNPQLIKKLRLPENGEILVLNAPDGYLAQLGLSAESAVYRQEKEHGYDYVQMFFSSVKDVEERAEEALKAIKPEGLLWLCYPKGGVKAGTDLNRDHGWETVRKAGYEGVALVSIDETWSAMRYRPAGAVKPRATSSGRTPKTSTPAAVKETPEDLAKALQGHSEAERFFAGLAPSHRKAYIDWIEDAKREETRRNRVAKSVEKLEMKLKRPQDKA